MAIRNHLLKSLFNRRGQILIESVLLILMVTTVLVIFKQLIEFQNSKKQYRFSKITKEQTYATELKANNTTVNNPK